MRVEDFPRPKNDNRRGVHWSASIYHLKGAALDFWIDELTAMRIKWVKLLDDSGGSSLELCQRLLAADIMPIVRLWRAGPNPGYIGGREEDTLRRLIGVGVRYFETNNEPDLPAEWKDGWMPSNWLDVVINNFIIDADKVIGLGGLPAVPAMGVGSRDNPVALIVAKGRADLFQKGVWVAIHNYTLNHPLDYPYDSVNQEGTPLSQAEYDRLGPWAWEGRPREMINGWRASDKNPGATLYDDANCFLACHLMDEMIVKALGYQVPIISTEGGPVVGWREDRRYPRIDPQLQAAYVVAINDFMQGGREINGIQCPKSYFAMCHWLLGNYRLGFLNPGWESQSWYTDWWNGEFNLKGQLPVVAAVKTMPDLPVPQGGSGVLTGQLVRAEGGGSPGTLEVKLLAGEREIAAVKTGTDGRFRFERLAPGSYDLAVAPWGTVRRGVKVAGGATPQVVIWLVGGRSSTLAVRLLDHESKPRAGARINLRRDGAPMAEATTDAAGKFRFTGLPLGNYQVRAPGITVVGIMLDGWAGKEVKLTTGTPSGYRYAVTRQRLLDASETGGRRIFFGTVTDAAGKPVDGVKVQMAWENAAPGTVFPVRETGHDPYRPAGSYEFTHTPGTFRLQVVADDWPSDVAEGLETAHVPGREGQPITYEISFQMQLGGSPTRVDGLVPGAPEGAPVKLIGEGRTVESRLAADAMFSFSNVPPGDYRLEMPGIGVLASDVQISLGMLYRIFFPLGSKLAGQVLHHAEGMMAVLYAPPSLGWTRQAPLDAAGKFAFERLPPGRYRLEVAGVVLQDLELTGVSTLVVSPIDPTLGSRSAVHGQVVDAAGKAQADLMVVLRREQTVVANAPTGPDGSFAFSNLEAGSYGLEVAGMGEAVAGIMLDGANEQMHNIVWKRSAPRGVAQGRVLASDGVPQPGVPVRLLHNGAEVGSTSADFAGTFRFGGLDGGAYELAIGDGAPVYAPVRLEEGGTSTVTVRVGAERAKTMARYVLLGLPTALTGGSPEKRQAEQGLTIALQFIQRSGAEGGFDVEEAMKAERVIVVGEDVPEAAVASLRAAGCRVTCLPDDPVLLAEAFERLTDA